MTTANLSELKNFQRSTPRSYGFRLDGLIETPHGYAETTLRLPQDYTDPKGIYINATPWTSGKATMRTAAIEQVKAGYWAVTTEYTNIRGHDAMERNVEDYAVVLLSSPEGMKVYSNGMSMGGFVVSEALKFKSVRERVASTTAIAPAGYIEAYDALPRAARNLANTTPEFLKLCLHTNNALWLGSATAANCRRRARGVFFEMIDLMQDNVHKTIKLAKETPQPTYVQVLYGLHDKLIPKQPIEAGMAKLPLDHVEAYNGGHLDFAYIPRLARRVIELNEIHDNQSTQPISQGLSRLSIVA
jgi:hypothetical protein